MKPTRLIQIFMAWLLMLFAQMGQAQVIYGVGNFVNPAALTGWNQLFTVSPTTGAVTFICNLGDGSTANAANSVDGLIYYITRNTPAVLRKINPSTCADTVIGNPGTVLDNTALRMTFCPDGRLYASGSNGPIYEISSTTGAVIRTFTTNLPTGGSGDMACDANGTLWVVAPIATGNTNYGLYSIPNASYELVPNNSALTFTYVGPFNQATGTGAPNGIAFGPFVTGCAPAPTPCLFVSTGATSQTWVVNAQTGAASILGSTGASLGDLASPFLMDLSINKTVTPTNALPGQTVVYTIIVGNSGTAATTAGNVSDTFPSGISSPTWACAVNTAGLAASLVTTSCSATSGTGNISQTLSLAPGGSVRYTVTATVSNNATTTVTNTAQTSFGIASLTDNTPSNNISTATTGVTPAANLQVTKTDGVTSTAAGSTINYTVTFSNLGPSSADNAIARDSASAGLSNCSVVSCSVTGAAVCPVAGNLPNLLTAAGVAIPTFPANSTVTMIVRCGVTATGQ